MNVDIKKYLSNCPTAKHWEKIGLKDHHGFCIPLFSIRSKKSCGIGEFTDLYMLIDWSKKISSNVIQLLPINEGYLKDPSPYNSISSCALDPIYIGLEHLKYLDENKTLQHLLKSFKKYNHTKRVKHSKVRKKKYKWLKAYFKEFYKQFEKDQSYLEFIKKNPWLKEYSVFRTLKELFKGKKWITWSEKFKNPTEELLSDISKKYKSKTNFYIFLQYLCFSQLYKVKNYATKNNILIKGDIPILINPDSVDVWYYRSVFDLSHVAGAPPDDFNNKGHKWGFFLFNWGKLQQTNYSWWKQRLSVLENIYHIYRIDHAVGFFRIWAIEPKDEATHGKFLPKDPSKWRKLGTSNLLMLINSSTLLPIAEDLGLIPNYVYDALKELGVCGTKVPRWETATNLKELEKISLTTLSTHDTETNTLWWKNHKNEAKILSHTNWWKYKKVLDFELRKKILYDTHHSASIFHINLLQEYLALFKELVWKNPKQERINVSGVVSKKNWTYRFRPTLEEITTNEALIEQMREIIQ